MNNKDRVQLAVVQENIGHIQSDIKEIKGSIKEFVKGCSTHRKDIYGKIEKNTLDLGKIKIIGPIIIFVVGLISYLLSIFKK